MGDPAQTSDAGPYECRGRHSLKFLLATLISGALSLAAASKDLSQRAVREWQLHKQGRVCQARLIP